MRQRVALARTLVNDPAILLLDEPFAALDFQTKLLIESDTAKLVRNTGRAVLLITHDIEEAVSLAGSRRRPPSQRDRPGSRPFMISRSAKDRTVDRRAGASAVSANMFRQIWADLDVVLQ